MPEAPKHILSQLNFPDRYERLSSLLGNRVAELLIPPPDSTLLELRSVAHSIDTRGEGFFCPLAGLTGTGKTTLANSLGVFLPEYYCQTIEHPESSTITFESLQSTAVRGRENTSIDDHRILPVNIDNREGAPPSERELAEIKRFLRSPKTGSKTIVMWPETTPAIAQQIGKNFQQIAGATIIPIPLEAKGPARETWQDVALHILHLCNEIASLEELGINPKDYDPEKFKTLGEFLKKVAIDFDTRAAELRRSTQRPLHLLITFVTESIDAGALTHLTTPSKYGLLDANGLLNATKDSAIGRWWANRRALLTQSILKLNARAFHLPPSTSVIVLRRFGHAEVVESLKKLSRSKNSKSKLPRADQSRVTEYIKRTDLGKYMTNSLATAYETRGRPPEEAKAVFSSLAKLGHWTGGKDKLLNSAMLEAIKSMLTASSIDFSNAQHEKAIEGLPLVLIPDNSIQAGEQVFCIEYAWRSGDFLSSGNRSGIAQYALTKLKNYALAFGWTPA
ncbi:hypothetical protein OV208_30090 [Corallococcus sp. bb12-1]|uniref:hypothetical protein n=1 Tax=Corallococcus sp. bb12-1 TaxID=2996784 RepID=UPI0022715BDB|nr:hypothetical protein [Corallococcus sp. bb12-1]MCY1045604.1 hypothetical protein [Corallococcus sp. bb12-1]